MGWRSWCPAASAFIVDALVLTLLTAVLGIHPILARIVAIALAMVAGWLMHRTFTFACAGAAERCRVPALCRRGVDGGRHQLRRVRADRAGLCPAIEPLVALVVSSAVAMAFSYLGMRFAAFR